MKSYLPQWKELISQSFLSDEFKADYNRLLNQRTELL